MRTITNMARGLMFAALIGSPLLAVQNVRAGNENIIEGDYERSSGAGLVLMVSLKRSR
ncbi:hypothetical protein SAMN05216452_3708 [Nitratireductor aquibiodomus]|uniref:Uncharacterized protein n=2 Tax=Nitratireductor TaxID=245876 RepID=A0A1H4NBV4_9HYPH|nr:hypothetical protein [Nitratireductor aquibiodomus]SEB92736.1 hypothetical protein SAMN05216452_3708 [Nitratireductor aquibiodomus]